MAKKDSYTEWLKEDYSQLFKDMNLTPRQEHFMKSRWMDQTLWLDNKASQCRKHYQRLRITTIVLGAIVPVLISLDVGGGYRERVKQYLTVGLSAIVAVSAAVEEFFHYGERWTHYRRTTESMKSQLWQFYSLTGPYKKFSTNQAAFKAFATQIEDVIQKDVEVYVTQNKDKDDDDKEDDSGLLDAAIPAAVASIPAAVETLTGPETDSSSESHEDR